MATVDNYKIKITVDGKEEVVDLAESVDELGVSIGKAATAGIAAFTALAASAINMAADIDGVSKATGVATADIYKLSKALEISGGEFNDSAKLLQAFSRALGQVETGSQEAIDALTKLGLSRQEIETLSDQELFNRVIQGLGGMEAGFERTQLAMTLLGKSSGTLEFDKLAAELAKASDPNVARNFELAADAMDNITSAFRELQLAALNAIAPILEELAKFEFTAEDAKKAIQVLGALIAAAFAASTVLQMKKVIDLFKKMALVIRSAATAQAFLTGLTGVGLAAVAAAGAAATAAYVALGKAMENAADEKEKLDGPAGAPDIPGTGGTQRTVGQTPEEKALEAIRAQTMEMRKKNEEANKYQRLINSTIGLSEREATIIKTNADLEKAAADQKLAIQKQIDVELSKGTTTNKAIVEELQKQLIEVDKQLAVTKQLKLEEIERLQNNKDIAENLANMAESQAVSAKIQVDREKDRLNLLVARGELTEKQAQLGQKYFEAEMDHALKMGRLLDRQFNAMNANNDKEIDHVKLLMSYEEARYNDELQRIANLEAAEVIKAQNTVKGIEDAMANIGKAFTPYQMAQDAILMTWNKIGSAVDQFVETGKFKFSDFARSVIADLAKMIIKAQLFKAISSALGFFGLSIPGLAGGGPAKAGQPYVVGEKGPELFVPKQAGTVIPNDKLGMSKEGVATGAVSAPVTNNYITNNISALDAQSVAQLFAANRKTLLGTVRLAEKELPYAA